MLIGYNVILSMVDGFCKLSMMTMIAIWIKIERGDVKAGFRQNKLDEWIVCIVHVPLYGWRAWICMVNLIEYIFLFKYIQ